MKLTNLFRRTNKETEYTEPKVHSEEWVRVNGKMVKVGDKDENAKEGK